MVRLSSRSPLQASASKAKHWRKGMEKMEESLKRLKLEKEEISEEQKNIRETWLAQRARTQVKLALMFRILKARAAGMLCTAATLTKMLCEIEGREREESKADI